VLAVLAQIPASCARVRRAAFYVFPDISVAYGKTHGPTGLAIGNDVDFCNALLEAKGVACVPGSAFGEPRAMATATPARRRSWPRPGTHPAVLRRAAVTPLTHTPRTTFCRSIAMKQPVRVAVTGAAGQIGYALLFRIASGEMLGKDQPVILQMLELPLDKAQAALKGVMMELEDCAFRCWPAWSARTIRASRSRTPMSRCWSARVRAARAWNARTCCSRTRRSSPNRARR
jgi:hypothetical protein